MAALILTLQCSYWMESINNNRQAQSTETAGFISSTYRLVALLISRRQGHSKLPLKKAPPTQDDAFRAQLGPAKRTLQS